MSDSNEQKRSFYAQLQGLNLHFDNKTKPGTTLNLMIERPVSKRVEGRVFQQRSENTRVISLPADIQKFNITDSEDCKLAITSMSKLGPFNLNSIRPIAKRLGLGNEILGMSGKAIHELLREQISTSEPGSLKNRSHSNVVKEYRISIRNDEAEMTVEMDFVIQVWEYESVPSTGKTKLSIRSGPWYL